MKILIVSGAFYPQNSPRSHRTTELVKEFSRQGHDVTLCIPQTDVDHSGFLSDFPIKINYIPINRNNDGITIFKQIPLLSKIWRRLKYTYLAYPDIQFLWKLPNFFRNEKITYDLLITIAVPHPIHWGMSKALKKNPKLCKTWIGDCGDPFMLQKSDSFRTPFYFKCFELDFCKNVNYISVPFKGAIDGYYPQFHHKIKIIPQAFNFNEVSIEEYKRNDIPTFYYSGGFIPGKRDPRPILDFLLKVEMDFKFIIYTRQRALIENYIPLFNGRLIVRDYIPRLELIKIMSMADFLINLDNNVSEQLPSKIIDYALSNRPILSLNSSNMDCEALISFLNHNFDDKMKVNLQDYDIQRVVGLFIKLIDK